MGIVVGSLLVLGVVLGILCWRFHICNNWYETNKESHVQEEMELRPGGESNEERD